MERIINSITYRPDQVEQHKKEAEGKALLKSWCKERKIPYREATKAEDVNEGWDVQINFKKYDLKETSSDKITVFKNCKGKWYSPLTKHMNIPYLYKHGNEYYVIKKEDIIKSMETQPPITVYTGDGNYNLCCQLSESLFKECLISLYEED